MAKKKAAGKTVTNNPSAAPAPKSPKSDQMREPAEVRYRDQLEALRQNDDTTPPEGWNLSPKAVLHYIVGGKALKADIDGKKVNVEITRKFFGDDALVERAIVTLASERALLLVGKSWLSEHLAAAISGNSTLTIQGTAGTTEEHTKYSWNIARVIAEGPTPHNLIPSPTMIAMRNAALLRFEEVTRCVPDVQDSLVSILSDKAIAIPELPDANMVWAKRGFNIIATANSRDQGVNELSAALKRRFNYIHIPIIADQKTEVEIVQKRSAELIEQYNLPVKINPPIITMLATVFREIRNGRSSEGVSVKQPSTTLSTAEAIGVALDAALHAKFFGSGTVQPSDVARNMVGSIVKEDQADLAVLKEYVTIVAKKRSRTDKAWKEFHDSILASLK
jgi:MoxR-like ATPase